MGFTRKLSFKLFLVFLLGPLAVKLGLEIISKESMNFFIKAAEHALDFRATDSEKKKDFVQIMVDSDVGEPKKEDMKHNEDLLESQKGHIYSKTGLTREEIVSASLQFFFAGFDTVANAVSFLCYNL